MRWRRGWHGMGFFRAHRSYVVNLQQVGSIMVWSRNAYTLTLHCNREISLSKHASARSGGC